MHIRASQARYPMSAQREPPARQQRAQWLKKDYAAAQIPAARR